MPKCSACLIILRSADIKPSSADTQTPPGPAPGGAAAEVDIEGDSIDLESLLSQLLEFLLTLIGNRRYQGGVKASMAELQYLTLGALGGGEEGSRGSAQRVAGLQYLMLGCAEQGRAAEAR